MEEPEDGAMVVTVNLRGERICWWRDDAEAIDWESHPNDRWFSFPDEDPMGWPQVLKYAETVHLVNPEAMR